MRRRLLTLIALAALVALLVPWVSALGGGGDELDADRLSGYEETPAVSSTGRGEFDGAISGDGKLIRFELEYRRLEAPALFAHLHLGQEDVAGGVIAFLCGGGGKPACPAGNTGATARFTGTISAADVIGPAGQGIAPGEFAEVVRALREGVVYVNVHSSKFPAGEVRGQIEEED